MAEFLIKAKDVVHTNPSKNLTGCYKRGDVVEIRPDGAEYGTDEGLPNFVVIKVTGLTFEAAKKYMIQQYMGDVIGETPDPEVVTKRRKYRVRIDDVPAAILQTLRDVGEITLTWTQVRNYLRNKATGLDEV